MGLSRVGPYTKLYVSKYSESPKLGTCPLREAIRHGWAGSSGGRPMYLLRTPLTLHQWPCSPQLYAIWRILNGNGGAVGCFAELGSKGRAPRRTIRPRNVEVLSLFLEVQGTHCPFIMGSHSAPPTPNLAQESSGNSEFSFGWSLLGLGVV